MLLSFSYSSYDKEQKIIISYSDKNKIQYIIEKEMKDNITKTFIDIKYKEESILNIIRKEDIFEFVVDNIKDLNKINIEYINIKYDTFIKVAKGV